VLVHLLVKISQSIKKLPVTSYFLIVSMAFNPEYRPVVDIRLQ